MTLLGLPVSTSQAVVGAIVGIGILNHQLNFAGLGKVVICWFVNNYFYIFYISQTHFCNQ